MKDSDTKVALVTGANRGIGKEIGRQLAAKGITVIVGARDRDQGMQACDALKAAGHAADFQLIDMAHANSIIEAVKQIKTTHARLDILVNNAGISIDFENDIFSLETEVLQNTLQTNALGPLALCQACIPLMKAQNYGRIVNVASTLGSLAEIVDPQSPYAQVAVPAYRLSKTLLNGITALVAKEVRPYNILVNSACPGWVRTAMGGEQAPLKVQEGADTPVWLATLADDGPTGGFFRERQSIPW